jgi:prevent-host-death family protein
MTSKKQQSKSLPSAKKRTRRSGSTKKGLRIREVALAKVKDDLSKYLRLAAGEEIVITRHGRPAGVLIGFESEDDWFDYRIENHPEFLRQIAEARSALQKASEFDSRISIRGGPTERCSRQAARHVSSNAAQFARAACG